MFKVIIFLNLTAIIFFAIAGNCYFSTQKLIKDGATTAGTVVKLIPSHSGPEGSQGVYYPIVRFTPEGGSELECKSHYGSNPPQFKEGETVPILYDKRDPTHWTINSWMNLHFLPVMFFAFGGGLTLAALITLVCSVRQRRPSGPIQ